MTMAAMFIDLPADVIDSAIHESLQKLAIFVGADRARVFHYDFDRQIVTNVHEWCAPRISSQIARLQAIPLDVLASSLSRHRRGDPIETTDVAALPPGSRRDLLLSQDIKSLVTIPLLINDECVGFIGLNWVRQRHTPSDNEIPLLRFFATLLTSIWQRQQMDAALQVNEKRFRALIEHCYDAFVLLGADGTVLYDSPAVFRITGYTPEERMGRKGFEFARPEDREKFERDFSAFVQQRGAVQLYEFIYPRKDGTLQILETVRSNCLHDPAVQAVVTNFRDITERRLLEQANTRMVEQHRQTLKMEAVGRLAGGVAHDFNNLLMTIQGNADLCRQKLPPEHPLQARVREIVDGANRAANLTRQLLAFARKQTITPKPLDLNAAVTGALVLLQRLVGENISIIWHPRSDLWRVCLDTDQVDHVLINLASNARDAITSAGSITITTNNVTLAGAESARHSLAPGDYVLLTFRDTGCGMPPEAREHVFEPFFTTKSLGKGTGLGMATVHGIIKQHGGDIEVETGADQGTCFSIYWPRLSQERDAEQENVPPAEGHGGGETILLVEDDESVRDITCLFLESLNYRVLCAENPEAALRMAMQYPDAIHLLLMDVIMPGMNGKELSRRLAEIRPGMPCVYISGFTADVLALRSILDASQHFLAKPFTREDLNGAIRSALAASDPGASPAAHRAARQA